MSVIFRWIFFGCLSRSLTTLAVILAIFVIIETFDKARYLGHGLTSTLLVEYIALKAPFLTAEFMPIIVLIGASIYLTDLSKHYEVVAIRASGLGIPKILMPLLAVAAIAALFSFTIGEWITPVTNQRLDHIEQVYIQKKDDVHHGVQWLKDGRHFFRLTALAPHTFALLMLEVDEKGTWVRRIDAAKAIYADGNWQLQQVQISQPSDSKGTTISRQKQMMLPSTVGPKTATPPEPRHMNARQLHHYIKVLEHAGLSSNAYIYSLHRKFSAPIACLFMIILASALCARTENRSKHASIGIMSAISIGLLYYILGNAGYLLSSGEQIPAAYAAWLPTMTFGGLALFLLLQREGY